MKNTEFISKVTGLAVIIMLSCLGGAIWAENNHNLRDAQKNNPLTPFVTRGDPEATLQTRLRRAKGDSEKELSGNMVSNEKIHTSNQPKDTTVEPSAKNKPEKWDGDPEGTASSELHGQGDNQDDEHSGKVDIIGDGNSGNNDKGEAKRSPDEYRDNNRDDEHSGQIDIIEDGNSGNNAQSPTEQQSNSPADQRSDSPVNSRINSVPPQPEQSNSPTVQQSDSPASQQTDKPVTNVTESKPINNPLGNNRSVNYRVKQEHYKFDRPVTVTRNRNQVTSPLTVSSSTAKNNESLTQAHFRPQLTEGSKFLSRAGTNAQILNQLGFNDPSIIEMDFTVEPIEYSTKKKCHRIRVTCRNLKIHFWDNNINFKYDFNQPEHVRTAWNQLYLALTVFRDDSERRLARDRQEKALAVQAVDYHELIHTLGYVALHNRSFILELSNNNRQINLVDFNTVLDETFNYIPISETLAKIKSSLEEDLLKNIKLLFPEINQAGSTEIKGNRINYQYNNLDKTDQTGNQYGEKDRKQNIAYDKKLKIVVNHQEKEESRFLNRGNSNNLQLSQEGRNREIKLISYEK